MPYLDAFVLTRDPRPIELSRARTLLGEIFEGIIVVETFPASIEFGIYLQLGFDPDEFGSHTLVVDACLPQGGATFANVASEPLNIARPSDDWWAQLVEPVFIPFLGRANGEAGFDLVVTVDEDELSSKGIVVARATTIPHALPADWN